MNVISFKAVDKFIQLSLQEVGASNLVSIEALLESNVLEGISNRDEVLLSFWDAYNDFCSVMTECYAEQQTQPITIDHGKPGINNGLGLNPVENSPIINKGNDNQVLQEPQITFMGLVRDDNGHWFPKEN